MDGQRHAICVHCEAEVVYFPGDPVICQCCGANYGLLDQTEYCPKCSDSLESSEDVDRLCATCGWFGDASETLPIPAITGSVDESVDAIVRLYREQCRQELILEQGMERGTVTWDEMTVAREAVAKTLGLLLTVFNRVNPPCDREDDDA